MGIYKRTQESKKTRKQDELDEESDQEKKKVFFLFSWSLSCSSSCFFLYRFLGRVLVFLCFFFINSHLGKEFGLRDATYVNLVINLSLMK